MKIVTRCKFYPNSIFILCEIFVFLIGTNIIGIKTQFNSSQFCFSDTLYGDKLVSIIINQNRQRDSFVSHMKILKTSFIFCQRLN